MKKKILIVDDKIDNIIALEMLLKSLDVEVHRALSGNEALEKSLEHDFALALMDVQMPEMDGFETVRLMRKLERTKYLPVIFLSAIYFEDQYKIQGIEAGAVDFISKPFIPRMVLGKIQVFLELYEYRRKLEIEIEQRKQTEASLLEIEKRLLEAKQKAEESDKLKSAFLANMSHEIRTPLTSIVGFSGLIADMQTTDEMRKSFAKIILKSSENLTNIINDILDISKIESGQFNITYSEVDIDSLLTDLYVSSHNLLKKMNKQDIELKLNIPDQAINKFISDENRLKQLLSNLLNNAAKFTLEGTIEFGYKEAIDGLVFYVKDTGIGIPEDKFEIIFDRFKKLDNKKVQNVTGTGLGLPISKNICEMLGGKIEVSSEENKGSEFSVFLPFRNDIKIEKIKKSENVKMPESFCWKERKMLIVEDDSNTYLLLESLLAFTGIEIDWAKDGREAIEIYTQNENYHLVLMDINMPEMSGIQAFKQLRMLSGSVPIIAHTAYAMADEKEYLGKLGFNGYISKPIDVKELFRVLNPYLS